MKTFLTVTLLVTCLIGRGQNLVPNGSFEQYDTCPTALYQLFRASGWTININTTDYYNECASSADVSVPDNLIGYQNAATGVGYAGFSAYAYFSPLSTEFLGGELMLPLVAGTKYYISFKVSLADKQSNLMCGVDKIGIVFTNEDWGDTFIFPPPFLNYPNFYTNNVIVDTLNWVTISGNFTSDSAYKFFMLGCFFDSTNKTFLCMDPNNTNHHNAYYYVDDVCISTDSLTCNTTVDIKESRQTNTPIFPNPFSTQLTFFLADNEQVTVSLYNFLGQQVLQQIFTYSTTINTEQLANGIYFYELRNDKGVIKTGKVVKQ